MRKLVESARENSAQLLVTIASFAITLAVLLIKVGSLGAELQGKIHDNESTISRVATCVDEIQKTGTQPFREQRVMVAQSFVDTNRRLTDHDEQLKTMRVIPGDLKNIQWQLDAVQAQLNKVWDRLNATEKNNKTYFGQ